MHTTRNITIAGRRTSLRLEVEYWSALDEIRRFERFSMHDLCALIRSCYPQGSLASAARLFATRYFRELAAGDAAAAHTALPRRAAARVG